jgi:hypothetical protein
VLCNIRSSPEGSLRFTKASDSLDAQANRLLGAVCEFDKAMVVAKLRERKRATTGKKVEGRKSHAELRPEVVALVRQFRRRRPKGGQRSLRDMQRSLRHAAISTSVVVSILRFRLRRCFVLLRGSQPLLSQLE